MNGILESCNREIMREVLRFASSQVVLKLLNTKAEAGLVFYTF